MIGWAVPISIDRRTHCFSENRRSLCGKQTISCLLITTNYQFGNSCGVCARRAKVFKADVQERDT